MYHSYCWLYFYSYTINAASTVTITAAVIKTIIIWEKSFTWVKLAVPQWRQYPSNHKMQYNFKSIEVLTGKYGVRSVPKQRLFTLKHSQNGDKWHNDM